MAFNINSSAPPSGEGAVPHGDGYTLHLPKARGRNGNGKPCGAVGLPWVEIVLARTTVTGWNWWVAQVGVGNLSADKTNIETWNPYKSGGAGWTTFSTGILHMPEPGRISYGNYEDVKILITDLEE